MEFLFVHSLPDGDGGLRHFRFPELDAIATLLRAPTPVVSADEQSKCALSPYVFGTLPTEKHAERLCRRSVLTKAVHQCWGHGQSLAHCVEAVRNCPLTSLMPYIGETETISVTVTAYGRTFTAAEQRTIIEQFNFLPVTAKIALDNPKHRLFVLFDYGDSSLTGKDRHREPVRVYFTREVARAGKMVHHYRLNARPLIGPTSMPPDLAFLYANQALARKGSLIYDPFIGTGSLLVACAHFGATAVGSDLDWMLLHGRTKGGKAGPDTGDRFTIYDNFRHYRLQRPEILCSDQSWPVWRRNEVFDAIVTDPPYGVRAGARKSGRSGGEIREVRTHTDGSVHIPPSQLYEVEDVIHDLLDTAARVLKVGGRLVYALPTSLDFTDSELPQHPCLAVIACSQQSIRAVFTRRLITMQKHRQWHDSRRMYRRDKNSEPTPKYANIKDLLGTEAALATLTSAATETDRAVTFSSKRVQRKNEKHIQRLEHRKKVKSHHYADVANDSTAVILYNAIIYTDADSVTLDRTAGWMIVRGKKVHEVGDGIAPIKLFPPERRVNLERQTVLPGLIDSHIHVLYTGKAQYTLDLSHCRSIDELKASVSARASTSGSGGDGGVWLLGSHWDHTLFADARYPHRSDIDTVCDDRPVFALRTCYHIAVVNTRALQIANITRDTPDPVGGAFDRDTSGEPTGILREKAVEVVQRLIVESHDRIKSYIRRGLSYCLSQGLTAVHTNDEQSWSIYKELVNAGELPLRVFLTIPHSEIGDSAAPRAKETYGELLECHRVKIFADGALGAETAALSQPYIKHRCANNHHHSSDSDNFGILIQDQASLTAAVSKAKGAGFRIECHVIGDRAAEVVLTACQQAGITCDDRPILTHCQVLSQPIIDSMASMGVIADIQPQFANTDCRWVDERLSPALQQYAYVWKTLMDANIVCAGGSDSPIELPSPLLGMHAAIYRPRTHYTELLKRSEKIQSLIDSDDSKGLMVLYGGSWREDQCLSVAQALALYTANGAYCAHQEHRLGRLSAGYEADLTVVDRNVIAQPHALLTAQVTQVWVAGKRRQ